MHCLSLYVFYHSKFKQTALVIFFAGQLKSIFKICMISITIIICELL